MSNTSDTQSKRKTVQKVGPTPPPPRPASVASSASSQLTSRSKPGPPVARKPAHLTSLSPSASPKPQQSPVLGMVPRAESPGGATVSLRDVASKYTVQRGDSPSQETEPPKLPRRVNSEAVIRKKAPPAGAVGVAGLSGKEDKPRPPPRKHTVGYTPAQGTNKQNVDLLGDDTNGDVGGWEALKPM